MLDYLYAAKRARVTRRIRKAETGEVSTEPEDTISWLISRLDPKVSKNQRKLVSVLMKYAGKFPTWSEFQRSDGGRVEMLSNGLNDSSKASEINANPEFKKTEATANAFMKDLGLLLEKIGMEQRGGTIDSALEQQVKHLRSWALTQTGTSNQLWNKGKSLVAKVGLHQILYSQITQKLDKNLPSQPLMAIFAATVSSAANQAKKCAETIKTMAQAKQLAVAIKSDASEVIDGILASISEPSTFDFGISAANDFIKKDLKRMKSVKDAEEARKKLLLNSAMAALRRMMPRTSIDSANQSMAISMLEADRQSGWQSRLSTPTLTTMRDQLTATEKARLDREWEAMVAKEIELWKKFGEAGAGSKPTGADTTKPSYTPPEQPWYDSTPGGAVPTTPPAPVTPQGYAGLGLLGAAETKAPGKVSGLVLLGAVVGLWWLLGKEK